MYAQHLQCRLDASLTKVEACLRVDGVEQLLPQVLLVGVRRKLQQAHASARRRQPCLIASAVANREFGVELRETEEGRAGAGSDKLDELGALSCVEGVDDAPERADRRVRFLAFPAAVDRVALEVEDVDGAVDSTCERGERSARTKRRMKI